MTDMAVKKKMTKSEMEQAISSLENLEHESHIPDMSYFDDHITRTMANNKNEYDIFDYAMKNKLNVLIEGPTGCGKTNSAIAYSAKKNVPFYSVASNAGIDPSQLFGRYVPDGNNGFKWVDGAVTSIVRHGGVLLLNEINFMPERVSTVLFGLLDKRRSITLMDHESETIEAHEDVLVIADMNPGYEGTRPLNKAFRNRFAIQMVWDYDPAVEKKLVTSASALKLAEDIRARTITGEYQTPFGTNMLIEFEKLATGLGYDFAVTSLVNHFADSERDSVRQLLNTSEINIKRDLGLAKKRNEKDEDYDDNEVQSKYPKDHPIWEKRRQASLGYHDDELGIKGVDWE